MLSKVLRNIGNEAWYIYIYIKKSTKTSYSSQSHVIIINLQIIIINKTTVIFLWTNK